MTKEDYTLWLEVAKTTAGQDGANLKARELYSKLKNKNSMEVKEIRIPTFGEQLIGIDIDDPITDDVAKIKFMFAEIAEIMKKNYEGNNRHPLKSLLFDHATGEIVSAQMAVVKVLTMKHYTENEVKREENND